MRSTSPRLLLKTLRPAIAVVRPPLQQPSFEHCHMVRGDFTSGDGHREEVRAAREARVTAT